MKKIICIMATLMLSGCAATAEHYASVNPDSEYADASCKGGFRVSTAGGTAVQQLDIEMLRKDHVGNRWVKVVRGQGVRFVTTWVRDSQFESINCDKQGDAFLAMN